MPTEAARRRTRLTPDDILSAIRRWHDLYGEPPSMTDWDPYRARERGQAWRISRYEAGEWPSVKSVRNHFGRLSDAVAAAGLVPRRQGQQHPRCEAVLDEDVMLHLAALRTAGDSSRAPAAALVAAIREVARARKSKEPGDLRAALVGLAAAALAWARHAESEPTGGMLSVPGD
jgi:hypothetical protein